MLRPKRTTLRFAALICLFMKVNKNNVHRYFLNCMNKVDGVTSRSKEGLRRTRGLKEL